MSSALRELVRLIESGMEYPDAHTKVCMKYNVDGDELTECYDKLN